MIKDQVERGIVEVVDKATFQGESIYYLLHHPVVREDKATTKLRIVYDASARTSGPSLNDCLYAGPKFNQGIMDILLRFRTYKTALAADIEKAFLMISVAQPDRDVLCFLWIDDIHKQLVHTCGVWGVVKPLPSNIINVNRSCKPLYKTFFSTLVLVHMMFNCRV